MGFARQRAGGVRQHSWEQLPIRKARRSRVRKLPSLTKTKEPRKQTTTNDSGNYSVTHLIPDLYSVKVEAQGFKSTEQQNVTVQADAGSTVDLQLQLGATTEAVEVTAEAPQLKTDRADIATTFNEKYVEDVPILNRNFTTLQLMAPGIAEDRGMEPCRN